MTTKREAALAAVEAALAGIAGIAGLTVERNPPHEADGFPFLALHDGGQRLLDETNEIKRYELQPVIEGFVQQPASSDIRTAGRLAGQALNALYGAVVAALYADRSLGGAAMDLFERDMSWDDLTEDGKPVMLAFELEVGVIIQTAVNDPSGAAP